VKKVPSAASIKPPANAQERQKGDLVPGAERLFFNSRANGAARDAAK
jgi:hypothetical protein